MEHYGVKGTGALAGGSKGGQERPGATKKWSRPLLAQTTLVSVDLFIAIVIQLTVMIVLYIDNFRGFKRTYIPLKEVNFLVGENSTGKTSILSLFDIILSCHILWHTDAFNKDTVKLGSYAEITDPKTKHFTIGILTTSDRNEPKGLNAIVMKFIQRGGVPIPEEFIIASYNIFLRVKITSEAILFKSLVDKLKEGLIVKSPLEFLNLIVSEIKFKTDEYNKANDYKKVNLTLVIDSILDFIIKEPFFDKKANDEINTIRFALSKTIRWMAPIRIEPKKVYSGLTGRLEFHPDGRHTPYFFKIFLHGRKGSFQSEFTDFIKEFLEESKLCDKITVKEYGNDETSPFEIHVSIEDKPYRISNVGYGVSQVLPIITALFETVNNVANRSDEIWYLIQQPEIHLHPKAQSALGEFIFAVNQKYGINFMIETHSDYIIDRFRINQNKHGKKNKKSSAQVLFFERTSKGNKVYPIDIDGNGNYSGDQPKSFREFFIEEELKLLEM
ncbi:MAG: AAA family ATPase [Nitrospirae bacterium]|nr:AAA family ATPase [Nitrospirota bacterium]MBF0592474.1 AAA family ATPase [Nitrospirota bacterium]